MFAGEVLIQCDVDSGAFGTYMDPDVALQGDVSSTAEARRKQEAEACDFDPLVVRARQDITRLLDGVAPDPGCVTNS